MDREAIGRYDDDDDDDDDVYSCVLHVCQIGVPHWWIERLLECMA